MSSLLTYASSGPLLPAPVNDHTTSKIFEDISICSICCMKFNESSKVARILYCGHTFCSHCLVNIKEHGNSLNLECPTCRMETPCDIPKIPINFCLMEILEKMKLLSNEPEKREGVEKVDGESEGVDHTYEQIYSECYRDIIERVKTAVATKLEYIKQFVYENGDAEQFREMAAELGIEIEHFIDEYNTDNEDDRCADSYDSENSTSTMGSSDNAIYSTVSDSLSDSFLSG